MDDSIVCPDCSLGADQCVCNNGISLPVDTIKIPTVKMKHDNFDRNSVIENVQQSFPFMDEKDCCGN